MIKKHVTLLLLLLQVVVFAQEPKPQAVSFSISIGEDSIVRWTTKNDLSKTPFIIEQYRWNKWIKIGEVYVSGSAANTSYSFKSIPNSGENQLRVSHLNESENFGIVKWTSDLPPVKFELKKDRKEIQFSHSTIYELIDGKGAIVKKGWFHALWYKDLPSGDYLLNYDNSSAKISL